MPVDIANYARQMHIGPECRWGVFLVEGKECEAFDIQNILKSVPEIRNTDFIASMEEDCVAVIRRLEDKDGEQYSHVFAEVLTNAVQRELKKRIRTSYGTLATSCLLYTSGASWMCYFRALQKGDINKVVPIDKSSTVLTILLALIFLL